MTHQTPPRPTRAEAYPPTPAPHGAAPMPSRSDLIVALVVYLLFAAPTVYLAVRAYTPCETNFEGGCSMGHALMAMGSILTAAGAAVTGAPLGRIVVRRRRAPSESATAFAASLLWAFPLLYIPLVVYDLFVG